MKLCTILLASTMVAGCATAPQQDTPAQIMAKITPYTASDERQAFSDMTLQCMKADIAPQAAPQDAQNAILQCGQTRLNYELVSKSRQNAAKAVQDILRERDTAAPAYINCLATRTSSTTAWVSCN